MGCPKSVEIGDNLTFTVTTHATTGAATDADSEPTYRVYEAETATPILTGTMAKLDDSNTTGLYAETIACTEANGFEKGKCYTIYISAAVDGTTGTLTFGFTALDSLKTEDIPTPEAVASQVRTELTTELATISTNLDAPISGLGSPQQAGEAVTLPTEAPEGYGGEGAPSAATVAAAVWAASARTLTGTALGVGPTAARNQTDIHYTVFAGATRPLYARVLGWDGADLQLADVSSITYSVFALDDQGERTEVEGHVDVPPTVADVLFDSVQSDANASDWNFRLIPSIVEHDAFPTARTTYQVQVEIEPTEGEKIVVRFRVTAT